MASNNDVYYSPRELLRPSSVHQALEELKKSGGRARVVGGNTTLYEFARQGALAGVETLIDAKGLGLDYIREDDASGSTSPTSLSVGSAVTFTQLAASRLIRDSPCWHALSEVASKITPPQVRNMATIGGATCSGIPFYDIPVVLLALDARAEIASLDSGTRMVAMEEFFQDYFITALQPEEMLIGFSIPSVKDARSSFVKLGRSSSDFAVVNVSARIVRPDPTRISEARIALGAVANTPIRARRCEEILVEDSEATRTTIIDRAAQAALEGLEPTPSIHASSEYKKKVIPFLVRDAILMALGNV